ncbi:CopG family ribbon-helix-helix protein [Sansalvadorimonas verongulae]|uniref:CopG family ribbon-helix-helix protein n=1 Tax=Sansalvadorimonas verongulae TaxID=2172824 RepID=UPI0012BB94CE|nr:ribbon-helix-helix protein, CopG family [Sansalvadorimonas verongulae]MTI15376.1 ribbon-helix-helix protein, CopG family [Sansalvadorimonas verongulae]
MAAKAVSVRLEEKTIQQLNKIAELAERDTSYIMRKAIEQFVEHERWIIEETSRRLKELETGKY